jgi:hypothetical protein
MTEIVDSIFAAREGLKPVHHGHHYIPDHDDGRLFSALITR